VKNRGQDIEASWACQSFQMARLCRLPCGKPSAFRSLLRIRRGFASGGTAAKRVVGLTESQRLSAREAAKPQNHLSNAQSRRTTCRMHTAAEPLVECTQPQNYLWNAHSRRTTCRMEHIGVHLFLIRLYCCQIRFVSLSRCALPRKLRCAFQASLHQGFSLRGSRE